MLTALGGEIVLTNLRVCQRTEEATNMYTRHVFLRHVVGCDVVHRRRASWLIEVAAALTLALLSQLAGRAEGVHLALASLPVFCALFYFSTVKTLEISSHTGSIAQRLDITHTKEQELIEALRSLSTAQKASPPG